MTGTTVSSMNLFPVLTTAYYPPIHCMEENTLLFFSFFYPLKFNIAFSLILN